MSGEDGWRGIIDRLERRGPPPGLNPTAAVTSATLYMAPQAGAPLTWRTSLAQTRRCFSLIGLNIGQLSKGNDSVVPEPSFLPLNSSVGVHRRRFPFLHTRTAPRYNQEQPGGAASEAVALISDHLNLPRATTRVPKRDCSVVDSEP